ncbi:MAG: amidase family protein [Pseudomonadota bacterium]
MASAYTRRLKSRAVLSAVFIALFSSNIWAADATPAFDPLEATILDMQLAMGTGRTSAVALLEFYIERIERLDAAGPTLNSVATLSASARAVAASLDRERAERGPRGPLHGIPILVKDNFETADMPTEAGSLVLEGFAPAQDAELVRRLRKAGAVIFGKTNMHEFAYGIETIGSAFGTTRNPYDPSRNPGGSSGGTGAAVAANFAAVGMGSDTCGSIRDPAAHNSLVGLRQTQGASSRDGIVPLSSTQDIGGPLARSVTDLALILDATAGYHAADPQTAASIGRFKNSFLASLQPDALRGARIGVVRDLVRIDAADDAVAKVFDAALAELRALGADVIDVSVADLLAMTLAVDDGFYVLAHDFGRDINAYLASRPSAPVRDLNAILATGKLAAPVQPLVQRSAAIQSDPQERYLGERAKRERLSSGLLAVMAEAKVDYLTYPTLRREAAPLGEVQPGDNRGGSAFLDHFFQELSDGPAD